MALLHDDCVHYILYACYILGSKSLKCSTKWTVFIKTWSTRPLAFSFNKLWLGYNNPCSPACNFVVTTERQIIVWATCFAQGHIDEFLPADSFLSLRYLQQSFQVPLWGLNPRLPVYETLFCQCSYNKRTLFVMARNYVAKRKLWPIKHLQGSTRSLRLDRRLQSDNCYAK